MPVGDMESAKHEIALLLAAATFATLLTAIDAEKAQASGSTVTTSAPAAAAIFEGAVNSQKEGSGYPVVEIIGHKTDYDEADQQVDSGTHEIGIYWTHVGDDELTITTQLERLVRATRQTCRNALLSAIQSAPVQVVSEEYTALMPTKTAGIFVKSSQTIVRVRTESL